MAKTFRNFEQVSQHFKCPVHLGKLKDPRRLPCEHTLCRDCLKGVIKNVLKREGNSGTLECPECRAKHHIPITETENWADWFPVDAFCVIQLKTLARFQDSQVCEVHEDKFKEYYCFHHRDLYCPDCIIEKHTNKPCYARNNHDAVADVRKHLNDLVGQLRLQEERAIRISDAKLATAHTDNLLQKVWEVDHMVDRFHKTMKKKLQEAKVQIENATKITPADKEHLKTMQLLITQTKRLVEDKLQTSSNKSKEAQNDLLRLWKPLDSEVSHFGAVLDAVEKRPYCVNIQADEPFLDLIGLNHEPIVILNESAQWTPLHPTKSGQLLNEEITKSPKRVQSFKETRVSSFKQSSTSSPRTNADVGVTLPRSRSTYRTLPTLTRQTGGSNTSRSTSDLPSIQHKAVEKSPTILPKLATASLSTGETSKMFHVRGLRLKGISQQSTFEFPCEDILVHDNNIITITERAVQKFSLRYQFLQSMALRAPLKLCYMRDDSATILVLDNRSGVSMVSAMPRLQLFYRIETDRAYTDVCHMRTTMTEDAYGRCMYHLHLALTHVWNREDCVDVMVVTYEKMHQTFGLMEEITLTPTKVKTICGSNDDPCLKNMCCISTAPDSRKLLIGAESSVVCMNRNGDIIWTYPTAKPASSVDSRRGIVYVAVELEKRVFLLDQHGNLLVDNIFPSGVNITRPIRVSVGKSSMIVREFFEHDVRGLQSMVHVFNLSF